MTQATHRSSEQVRLNVAPGEWLTGQWSTTAATAPVGLVYVHGFRSVRYGEKAQALEEACARRGWTFATFDFRAHGQSSGQMKDLRPSQLLQDLNAIHDFLSERGVLQIGLVGSSMGGWVAAWFALRHPGKVIATTLIAPGFHFLTARWEKLNDEQRQAWKSEGILRIRNDWVDVDLGYGLVEEAPQYPPQELIDHLHTPTLIFHGMADEIVPYQRSLNFLERTRFTAVELRLYKDGDHRLTDRKHEIAEASCAFVERFLTKP
jgi:pimeloyl-ACP methyl ester carboxylesterase